MVRITFEMEEKDMTAFGPALAAFAESISKINQNQTLSHTREIESYAANGIELFFDRRYATSVVAKFIGVSMSTIDRVRKRGNLKFGGTSGKFTYLGKDVYDYYQYLQKQKGI